MMSTAWDVIASDDRAMVGSFTWTHHGEALV
jgi:hypothetical protein